LVAGAGDLEEHPALLLQSDLAVVDGPGDAGQEEVVAQLLGRVGGQPGGEIVAGGRVGLLRCLRPLRLLRLLGGLLRRLRLRLGGLLRLLARLAPGLRRLLLRLRLARPAVLLLAVLRALAADGELGLVVGDRGDLRAAVAVAAVAGAGRLVAVGDRGAQVDDLAVPYRPHRLAPADTHLDPPGRFGGWLAPMVAHLTSVREGCSAICVPTGAQTARLARLTPWGRPAPSHPYHGTSRPPSADMSAPDVPGVPLTVLLAGAPGRAGQTAQRPSARRSADARPSGGPRHSGAPSGSGRLGPLGQGVHLAGLDAPQRGVQAAGRDQLVVRAGLDDPPPGDHADAVGFTPGRGPVGDVDVRAVAADQRERPPDGRLGAVGD